jgi:hypothetical protein
MQTKRYIQIFSLFFPLAIMACGGGSSSSDDTSSGYSGSTASAIVESGNSEDISRAANEVLLRSANYSAASGLFKSQETVSNQNIDTITTRAKLGLENALRLKFDTGLVARIDDTEACLGGGSVRIIFPDLNANITTVPQNGSGTLIYNNCNEFGEILDGRIDYVWNGFDDINGFINYTLDLDLTYTLSGMPAESFVGTISCTRFESCVSTEDFIAADGREVRVEDVAVTGDNFSGYNVTARVYEVNHGYVDIVATGIIFCDNGNIELGEIQVSDFTGLPVLVVNFFGCNEFTAIYNGVSTVYAQ